MQAMKNQSEEFADFRSIKKKDASKNNFAIDYIPLVHTQKSSSLQCHPIISSSENSLLSPFLAKR
jgi:hypothetical protein